MNLHQSLRSIVPFLFLILCSSFAFAEEAVVPATDTKQPLVEVEVYQDYLAPYKERRENHGSYVTLGYESLELKNYISAIDAKTYGDMFGTAPIALMYLGVDYKYNFALGSLAFGIQYGKGNVTGEDSGEERTMDVTKTGVGFKFTLDMIMNEPIVAPYIGLNIWKMTIAETNPTTSFSAETQMGMNYTVGLLLQLDWLDYETAKNTTFNWGLENTFIDVYATKYAKTNATDDANTETDMIYGGALRLEF
ncbi:hypothetical protein [Bdellovibrio reynosensis]|uniref:Outer membrane protein beta-barrel domain-containing protein n=1 Tax=Bdellovibrio reynosensis TaxID=2835041 RepID=A0ABY4C643_9BACT|nr:hypothetical protein [Bdellovibrio reynosensis]UOF00417.1 hypothetical protein MNR06_11980 [Bdellovibrio reynosensis]